MKSSQQSVHRVEENYKKKYNKQNKYKNCFHCGKYHRSSECSHRKEIYRFCRKKGHLEKMCFTKKKKKKKIRGPKVLVTNKKTSNVKSMGRNSKQCHRTEATTETKENTEYLFQTYSNQSTSAYKETILLDGKPLEMELDSGAALSIIGSKTFKML